jgi:hypothetical protein
MEEFYFSQDDVGLRTDEGESESDLVANDSRPGQMYDFIFYPLWLVGAMVACQATCMFYLIKVAHII